MSRLIESSELELDLLIEAIRRSYGHDFRHYTRASFKRRVEAVMEAEGLTCISELIPRLLHVEAFFERLLYRLSITVTEMFRDPSAFLAIRQKVAPWLKTHSRLKIWDAGCATGEETWSLAILLREEGLYERCQIYATDFNERALETARKGIYPLDRMRSYTTNYCQGGGRGAFSDYYLARYDHALIEPFLRPNVVFANHNLVTDGCFGDMHLVLCRNALIYFDRTLATRVLKLFRDSLVDDGILCLGRRESLYGSEVEKDFAIFDREERLYRKRQEVAHG